LIGSFLHKIEIDCPTGGTLSVNLGKRLPLVYIVYCFAKENSAKGKKPTQTKTMGITNTTKIQN
jgi:hypothetical protein